MEDIIKKQLFPRLESALVRKDNRDVEDGISMLLDSIGMLSDDTKLELAVEAVEILHKFGNMSYDKFEIFAATTRMVDIGVIYDRFPNSEAIALKLLDMISGVLGLKMGMGATDNMDIYLSDLLKITDMFPDNEKTALGCMMCYANIQALYASVASSMSIYVVLEEIDSVVDKMEAISVKFPDNEDINLVYCRSLAAVASGLQGHRNQRIYRKYIDMLRRLVTERKVSVSPEIGNFLLHA